MSPSISFCTSCMGRTQHLKQTYLYNIALCLQFLDDFEFLLLNYNSPDDMDTWVQSELGCFIATGTVKYFKTQQPTHYHMCRPKNIIHRQATKDIVVNLDADNRLSIFYLYALSQLKPNEYLYVREGGIYNTENVGGRIGIYRDKFIALGGYDEHLSDGWGFEDDDIVRRAHFFGLTPRWLFPAVIGNTVIHPDALRTLNLKNPDKWAVTKRLGIRVIATLSKGF